MIPYSFLYLKFCARRVPANWSLTDSQRSVWGAAWDQILDPRTYRPGWPSLLTNCKLWFINSGIYPCKGIGLNRSQNYQDDWICRKEMTLLEPGGSSEINIPRGFPVSSGASFLTNWILIEKWSNFARELLFQLNLNWKMIKCCSGAHFLIEL